MRVSFVVTVYNTETGWIQRCISSILNQTMDDFEILLIDDGSDKKIADFCDSVMGKDRRGQVIHQKNQGVCVARNAGVKHAKGTYIAFIDGDDWLEADYLESLAPVLDRGIYDIVCFGHYDHRGKMITEHLHGTREFVEYSEQEKEGMILSLFKETNSMENYPMFFGAQWNMLYAKRMIDQYNLRNIPGLTKSEDMVYNLYAIESANGICYLNKGLYHYYINLHSACHKFTNNIAYFENLLVYVEVYLKKYEKSQKIRSAFVYFALIAFLSCCKLYFFHPDNKESYRKRRAVFVNMMKDSSVAFMLNTADINGFTWMKKIQFYFMKYRFFTGIALLYKLREKKYGL